MSDNNDTNLEENQNLSVLKINKNVSEFEPDNYLNDDLKENQNEDSSALNQSDQNLDLPDFDPLTSQTDQESLGEDNEEENEEEENDDEEEKDDEFIYDQSLEKEFDEKVDEKIVEGCKKGLAKRCITNDRINQIHKKLPRLFYSGKDKDRIKSKNESLNWLYENVYLNDWKSLFQKVTEKTKSKVGLEKQRGNLINYQKSVDIFYKTLLQYKSSFLQIFNSFKEPNENDLEGFNIKSEYEDEDIPDKIWYKSFIEDLLYLATKQIPKRKIYSGNNVYTIQNKKSNPELEKLNSDDNDLNDVEFEQGILFDEKFGSELIALGRLKYDDSIAHELIASEYIAPQIVAQKTLFKQQNNFGQFSKLNEFIFSLETLLPYFNDINQSISILMELIRKSNNFNFWESFWENGNIGEKHLIKDSDFSKRMNKKVFRNMIEWNLYPDPCISPISKPTSSIIFCEKNLVNAYYFIDRIIQSFDNEIGLSKESFKNFIILDEFQDPISWVYNWMTSNSNRQNNLFECLNANRNLVPKIDQNKNYIDPNTFNNYYIQDLKILNYLTFDVEKFEKWYGKTLSSFQNSLNDTKNNLLYDYINPPSGEYDRTPYNVFLSQNFVGIDQNSLLNLNENIGNRFNVWIIGNQEFLIRDSNQFELALKSCSVVEFQTSSESNLQNEINSSIHLRIEMVKNSKINFWWKNFKKLKTDFKNQPELLPSIWQSFKKNGEPIVWDHWCSNLLNIASIVNGQDISGFYNGLPCWMLAIFKGLISFLIKNGHDSEKYLIYLDLAHLRLSGDVNLQEVMYYLCEYLDFGAAGPTIKNSNSKKQTLVFNSQNFVLQQYELYQENRNSQSKNIAIPSGENQINEPNQFVLERYENNNIVLFRPFPTKKELYKLLRFFINNLLGKFETRIYNLNNLFNYLYFDESLSSSTIKTVHTPAWKGKSQIPSLDEYFVGTNPGDQIKSPQDLGFQLINKNEIDLKTIDETKNSKYKKRERNGRSTMESLKISTLIWKTIPSTKMKYFIKNYFNDLTNHSFFDGISFQEKSSFIKIALDVVTSKLLKIRNSKQEDKDFNNLNQKEIDEIVLKDEFDLEFNNQIISKVDKLLIKNNTISLNTKGNKISFYLLAQLCTFTIPVDFDNYQIAIHPIELVNFISKNILYLTDSIQYAGNNSIIDFKIQKQELVKLYDNYICMKDETFVFQNFIQDKKVLIQKEYLSGKYGFVFDTFNQTGINDEREDDIDHSVGKLKQIKKQGDYLTLWKIICNKTKKIMLQYFQIILNAYDAKYKNLLLYTNENRIYDAETGFARLFFIPKSEFQIQRDKQFAKLNYITYPPNINDESSLNLDLIPATKSDNSNGNIITGISDIPIPFFINKQKSLYEILELPENATNEQILEQYKILSLKWHPDNNPNNSVYSKENISEITKAYQILSNPDIKQLYDSKDPLFLDSIKSFNVIIPPERFFEIQNNQEFENSIEEYKSVFNMNTNPNNSPIQPLQSPFTNQIPILQESQPEKEEFQSSNLGESSTQKDENLEYFSSLLGISEEETEKLALPEKPTELESEIEPNQKISEEELSKMFGFSDEETRDILSKVVNLSKETFEDAPEDPSKEFLDKYFT